MDDLEQDDEDRNANGRVESQARDVSGALEPSGCLWAERFGGGSEGG